MGCLSDYLAIYLVMFIFLFKQLPGSNSGATPHGRAALDSFSPTPTICRQSTHRPLLAVLRRSSLRRVLVKSNAIDWSVTMQMGGQAHARRLTLKPGERPPDYRKPPTSKVFQRYQLAQQLPPKILLTASRTSAKPELYKRCPRQHPGSQNL